MMPKSHSCGKENLLGKYSGCSCMRSVSSQVLIKYSKRFFFPITIPITINHYHVKTICLHTTINLKITLSGYQESRNSAGNFDLKLLYCYSLGMRPSSTVSTAPNLTAE